MEIHSGLRFDYVDHKRGTCKRTDEGYLTGVAPVAKVGVMAYRLPDGSVRKEYVPPETLFNADSMASLHMKPVTNAHPPEMLLNKGTVKGHKVGWTGERVQPEDTFLMASMTVTDADAITAVEEGRRQLSPGYKCDLRMEPGTYNGENYDAVQCNRRYNHVALVDNARGGASLQLNIDHADGIEIEEPKESNPSPKEKRMPLCKIDGIEYEAPAEVCRQIEKTDAAVAAEKAAHDATKAERDTLKAKNDELAKVDVAAEAQKIAKARTTLERQATPHLDAETVAKLDSFSDDDVRKAVILRAFPKATEQLASATAAYVAARYDAAIEILSTETGDDAMAAQRAAANSAAGSAARKDAVDSDKSRNDFEDRAKNAWKNEKK